MAGCRTCLLQKEIPFLLLSIQKQTDTELLQGGTEEINEANR